MPDSGAPPRFVRDLEPALHQAASIARALQGRVANRPKAGAPSPAKAALTIADTASQEALLIPLLRHFRSARLDAEEDTPSVGRFTGEDPETHVVVDPIDGTLHFYLGGAGPYAVMAGLAIAGRYEAGVVALPREELFLHAVRGSGARRARGEGAYAPVRARAEGRVMLVSQGLPPAVRRRLEADGWTLRPGAGGAIAVAPLVPGVAAGLRVAKRGGSISRQGRIGVLIAREAGACVLGARGEPFPEAIDAPAPVLVVAAERDDARALVDALRASDYMPE